MPKSFGSTLPKLKGQLLSTVWLYLSVKSSVGDALEARAVKGSAGGVVPGGSRGTGGGGGLLAGNTQKDTLVLLPQSSPSVTLEPGDELGCLPRKTSGRVDPDFPVTPKSSSSSKVTHPLGLLTVSAGGACGSKLSLNPSREDEGLLLFWPRGLSEENGLWATGSSLENHEVASDSWDSARNGFPGTAVPSVKGFVLLELGMNGFGERRMFSWDILRAGIGGIVGMQLTELRVFVLLGVAEGNGVNPLGFGVWTDGWAFDTASRFNDKSSNGSLFNGESSLTVETPFVFTWERESPLNNENKQKAIVTLSAPSAFCLNSSSFWGVTYTNSENKKRSFV